MPLQTVADIPRDIPRDITAIDGLRIVSPRPSVIDSWSPQRLDGWVRLLGASSLNTIAVPDRSITPSLRESCATHGVALIASVPCFVTSPDRPVDDRLWPIDPYGDTIPSRAAYRGIIPTDASFNAELLDRFSAAAALDGVTGVLADHIRWPVHWQSSMRRISLPPPRNSFDPTTLTRFVDWLRERGVDDTDLDVTDAPTSSGVIDSTLRTHWTRFRCEVITDLVRGIAERVHEAQCWVGAFVVPLAQRDRIEVAGQDTSALGPLVDALLPVTHHGVMRESPSWVMDVAADIRATSSVPLVAGAQLSIGTDSADGSICGLPIDLDESIKVADALHHDYGGFFVFPGDVLDRDSAERFSAALPLR